MIIYGISNTHNWSEIYSSGVKILTWKWVFQDTKSLHRYTLHFKRKNGLSNKFKKLKPKTIWIFQRLNCWWQIQCPCPLLQKLFFFFFFFNAAHCSVIIFAIAFFLHFVKEGSITPKSHFLMFYAGCSSPSIKLFTEAVRPTCT